MPYLNKDDGSPEHPKNAALSDAAYRFHDRAMHYAAKWLLDGYLTPVQVRDLARYKAAIIRELLTDITGLGPVWHDVGQGCGTKTCPDGRPGFYLIHDFLQWNKPREWWEAKRKTDAERQAEWRRTHGKETE